MLIWLAVLALLASAPQPCSPESSFSANYMSVLADAHEFYLVPNNGFKKLSAKNELRHSVAHDLASFMVAHGHPLSMLYQKVQSVGPDFKLEVEGLSNQCQIDLTVIIVALAILQSEWSLRFVDAQFKIPPGLLDGNLNWFGAFDECFNLIVDTPDFKTRGSHCLVPIDGLLNVAVCVPESCHRSDITAIVDSLNELVHNNSIYNLTTNLNLTTSEDKINCIDPNLAPTPYFYTAFAVVGVLVLVNVLSTGYDVVRRVRAHYSNSALQGGSVLDISTSSTLYFGTGANLQPHVQQHHQIVSDDDAPLVSDIDGPPNLRQTTQQHQSEQSLVTNAKLSRRDEFLLSFSIIRNISKILTIEQPLTRSQNTLQALHGIRLLSMFWLVLSHTVLLALNSGIDNVFGLLDLFQNFEFQVITHAIYAVDTFLVLGGFLLGYLTLRQLDKLDLTSGSRIKKIAKFFGKFYLHRYLRLTPCYALLVLVYLGIVPYFMFGPTWQQQPDPMCTNGQSWWKNLLYVHNLVDKDQECMTWTFYLSIDFQLFLISPIPILAFFWRPLAGWIVSLALVAASAISSGMIASKYDFDGAPFSGVVQNHSDLNVDVDGFKHLLGDYFFAPWCRASPWAIGLALGCALHRMPPSFGNSRMQSPMVRNIVAIFGWTISLCLGLLMIYGMWPVYMGYYTLTPLTSQFYWATSRIAWGLSISWVIYACVADIFPGRYVRQFLSWSPFIPLSRLTYCAFLFHPIIAGTYFWSARTPTHLYDMEMCYLFLASVVLVFASVFPVAFGVEVPLANLERLLLDRRSPRDKE